MPKFEIIKDGVNEALLKATNTQVSDYLKKIVEEDELTELEGIYSFEFGTVSIEIRVVPWHHDDVLVHVYSYLAEDVELTSELMNDLLRLNASTPFGSFGVSFDNTIVLSYSLAGANLDFNEFSAALQTVATLADEYDEQLKEASN